MDKLNSLTGAAFDRLWLQSMIGHHRGAIAMAQSEVEHGRSQDIVGTAQSVVATQQAQVGQMNQLLGVR